MIGKGVNHSMRISIGAACVLAIFTAPSNSVPALLEPAVGHDEVRLVDLADTLLIENGNAFVVVNAPDGPTLETRKELEQARAVGAKLLTIRLQNTGLTQDEELMELFRAELAELAAGYGFTGDRYILVECLEVCK